MLCTSTSLAISSVVINAYFLARTPKPSGQNPFLDVANSIGKLDFYIAFVSGVYMYAFPDRFNASLGLISNPTHHSLTRSFGAIIIGSSIASFCMSEFKFIRDKKRFLFARLLVLITALYPGPRKPKRFCLRGVGSSSSFSTGLTTTRK